MTQEHLQIEDWTFSAVPREKGRFGPDIRVSRGAESATVWLNETGFHSDNQALTGSMPPQVDDAYQGYLLGTVDGYEQTKQKSSRGGDEWQETGNEIAHSAQESSGWRIKGLVRGDNPPAFKVQVKAADGHVTDMAFDAQSAITATSTGKRVLPESVKQVAEAMLAGQRDGARVARNRPVSLAEREEARRNAASSAERSR
ncbi:MAG: hypothetical protein FJX23_02535 [Alphaproteobacteria bacterium]|nr:hypothetical protein [Alphaproteobacteria bacterium]